MKRLFQIDLNPNRIYGLDILRALAILFVVIGHGAYLMPPARYKYVNYFVFDGVSIFFVLSGFLIGGILIKILNNHGLNIKLILNFWKRRWFRTLPNYFLILTVLLILSALFKEDFVVTDKWEYYLFIQNLFTKHPIFFPEAWSLSIEEWFYLLLPILLFIWIKLFKLSINKALLITAIGIIVCVTLFRYYRYENLEINNLIAWDKTFRKQVFTRLDSLMFGVIGAYIFYNYKAFWQRYKKLLLVVGIALFLISRYNFFGFHPWGFYSCVFSFTTVSVATLFLLPYLSGLKNGKGFVYKFLTYISLISYSMYLINLILVQKWLLGSINWEPVEQFNGYLFLLSRYFLYWVFTVGISILLYKYFEIPVMNLRDRKW